jgi:hypothetical protein
LKYESEICLNKILQKIPKLKKNIFETAVISVVKYSTSGESLIFGYLKYPCVVRVSIEIPCN